MKIDSIKEKLSEFRFYRGLTVSLVVGIAGALLLKEVSNFLMACGVGALVLLLVIWLTLSFAISDKIKELESL